MPGSSLKKILRRLVEYAKRRLRSPFLKGKVGDTHATVESMIAERELYTSERISFPSSAVIETTTRCNLKCIMCARLDDPRPGEDLPYMAFERCMESLVPHLSRIDLNGHGETFINKQFMQIFEQAKKTNSYVAITTNATLIDEATADSLVRLGMDEMVISIDAASPELFEKIRKGARFQKVLENIDKINLFKAKYRRNTPHLDVQMVAMKMNIHELPALVKLAKERLKARSISVIPLKEYASVEGESLERCPELARKFIPEARRLASEIGIEFSLSPVLETILADEDLAGNVEKRSTEPTARERKTYMNCDDPWKFTFVDCAGLVRPCCGTDRTMGDLTQKTFPQIWYGNEYVEFRKELLSGRPPGDCLKCIHRTKFHK
jgi:MoaA/NifB/PqqE/SkfB family radical SAM enzyme